MAPDCFLCEAATGTKDLAWYDRPLWLDPRAGLMVAGLGGFSPGYLLVAPIIHELNLHRAASQVDRFVAFVNEVLSFLVQRFGALTFWEHGAPGTGHKRRSACIDHAHLHVVPGRLPLPEPPLQRVYATLDEALTMEKNLGKSEGYLLLGWTDDHVTLGADIRVPQYYRQEWARLIGRQDEWDYLVAENPNITAATIKQVLSINGE